MSILNTELALWIFSSPSSILQSIMIIQLINCLSLECSCSCKVKPWKEDARLDSERIKIEDASPSTYVQYSI